MKKIALLLSIITLVTLLFVSCTEEPEEEYGRLIMHAVLADGKPAVNAKLSLATSEYNMNKGVFVIEDVTSNIEGKIEVIDLPPKTYFYECVTINYKQDNHYATGKVVIGSGETKEMNTTLQPL